MIVNLPWNWWSELKGQAAAATNRGWGVSLTPKAEPKPRMKLTHMAVNSVMDLGVLTWSNWQFEDLWQKKYKLSQFRRFAILADKIPHFSWFWLCVREKKEEEFWGNTSRPLRSSLRKALTYLPHKAVAEVSNDKEPIGRGYVEFKWFESQLTSDSNELRVKWFGCQMIWDSNEFVVSWFEVQVSWLSIDLSFWWFGYQLMCVSNDFGCLLNWTSSEVVVNWFEIQAIWLSIGLRFKWVGCQLIWVSSDLVVNRFEI